MLSNGERASQRDADAKSEAPETSADVVIGSEKVVAESGEDVAGRKSKDKKSQGKSTEVPVSSRPEIPIKQLLEDASTAERHKKFAEANTYLNSILEREPTNFEALFRRARVAWAAGDVAAAQEFADRAQSIKPGHAWPSAILARAYEKTGRRMLALELWKNVPKSHSAHKDRLKSTARMLWGFERHGEAIETASSLVSHFDNSASQRLWLAEMYAAVWETASARAICLEVLQQDPQSGPARRLLESLDRPLSDAEFVVSRYRRCFQAEMAVAIAIGAELESVILGLGIARALHAYFGEKVVVIVPETNEATEFVLSGTDCIEAIVQVADIESSGSRIELAFVFPEFTTSAGFPRLTAANLAFAYCEMRPLRYAAIDARYADYCRWIADLLGVSNFELTPMPTSLAGTGRPVVVIGSSAARLDGISTFAALRPDIDFVEVLVDEMALTDLADEIRRGSMVICVEEKWALFAAFCGMAPALVTDGARTSLRRFIQGGISVCLSEKPEAATLLSAALEPISSRIADPSSGRPDHLSQKPAHHQPASERAEFLQ